MSVASGHSEYAVVNGRTPGVSSEISCAPRLFLLVWTILRVLKTNPLLFSVLSQKPLRPIAERSQLLYAGMLCLNTYKTLAPGSRRLVTPSPLTRNLTLLSNGFGCSLNVSSIVTELPYCPSVNIWREF